MPYQVVIWNTSERYLTKCFSTLVEAREFLELCIAADDQNRSAALE